MSIITELENKEAVARQFCIDAADQLRRLDMPVAAATYDFLAAVLSERCEKLLLDLTRDPQSLRDADGWLDLAADAPDPIAATPYRIYRRAIAYETTGLHDCLALGKEAEVLSAIKSDGITALRALAVGVLSKPEGEEDRETLRLAGHIKTFEALEVYLADQRGVWATLGDTALVEARKAADPGLVTDLEELMASLKAKDALPEAQTELSTVHPLKTLGRLIAVTNRVMDQIVTRAETEDLLLGAQAENSWCQTVLRRLRPHIIAPQAATAT